MQYFAGEEHCGQRSAGDVADLQAHQTGEQDRSRHRAQPPEEISPGHPPVGAKESCSGDESCAELKEIF